MSLKKHILVLLVTKDITFSDRIFHDKLLDAFYPVQTVCKPRNETPLNLFLRMYKPNFYGINWCFLNSTERHYWFD